MSEVLQLANPFCSAKIVSIGVDPDAYHRQEPGVQRGDPRFVMGRSQLMDFALCPHRWVKGWESKDSASTDWGSLMDCRVLDGARFKDRYAVAPATYLADARKKGMPQVAKPWNRNSTVCREWEEEQAPRTIIKADELAESDAALEVLLEDAQIATVLRDSDKQVMVVAEYRDKDTGFVIPVKTLIDILPKVNSNYAKQIFDYKTSVSADPSQWGRLVFQRGYHTQGVFYLDVYVAATGEDRLEFGHIVQENYAPFEVTKMVMSQEFLRLGRDSYLLALRKYCQCLASGEWPSYPPSRMCLNGWSYVEPEPWQLMGRNL